MTANPLAERDETFKQWLKGRPPVIRRLVAKFPPYALYRLKESHHIVSLYAYWEDGTMSVLVTKDLNPKIGFERRVFGIKPKDLERIKP